MRYTRTDGQPQPVADLIDLDLDTAKAIAAKYHGGTYSPLLAFVGHGWAFPSAIAEATEIMKRSKGDKCKELAQLVAFLEANNMHK